MRNVSADKAKKTNQAAKKASDFSIETTALDRCYGKIGISAVAAAARYQGGAKNPAYAPAPTGKWYEPADEAA